MSITMKFIIYLVCALLLSLGLLYAFQANAQDFPEDIEFKEWKKEMQTPQNQAQVLDYGEPQAYFAQYRQENVGPSNQAYDYGLIGAISLGVLALLAFTVKSDRADRGKIYDNVNALVLTNTNILAEMRRQSEDLKALANKFDNFISSDSDARRK